MLSHLHNLSEKARHTAFLQRRWYELVLAAQDDIATIMTVESGKPLAESKAEFLGGCAACVRCAAHGLAWFGPYADPPRSCCSSVCGLAESHRSTAHDHVTKHVKDKRSHILPDKRGVQCRLGLWLHVCAHYGQGVQRLAGRNYIDAGTSSVDRA